MRAGSTIRRADPRPSVDLRAAPEARLVRLLGATRHERQRHAELIGRLAEEVDARALLERLEIERLLGVLGRRLPDTPNVAAVREAAGRFAETAERDGTAMELLVETLLASLTAASIRAVSLKGPRLGRALYGIPGMRAPVDVDILVAAEDLWPAAGVLRAQRYGEPQDRLDAGRLPVLHLTLAPPPGLVPIELHWRIHWYETAFAREVLDAEHAAPARRRAIELVELLCYYARDGFAGLRLAVDIARWWDCFGDELDPAVLGDLLEAYPELRRAVVTAAAVAHDVVGLPFERVVVRGRDVDDVRGSALRFVNWAGRGTAEQLAAEAALFDLLLAPRGGRVAAARRQLFPPIAHFAYLHGVGPQGVRDARAAQALHPLRLAVRIGGAMVSAAASSVVTRRSASSSRAGRETSP